MTPAQKLKMGKEIAKDIGLRYKFDQSGKGEKTLYEAITKDKREKRIEGLKYFFSWRNDLFQQYEKMDILRLLVEKGCILEKKLEEYVNQQSKSLQDQHTFNNLIENHFPLTLGGMSAEEAQEYTWRINGRARGGVKKTQMLFDYLYMGQRKGINTKEEAELLQKLEELRENKYKPEERLEELEQEFLKNIKDNWKSGELKHALLNHTPKEKKRKTTLARSVPLNQLYPEKRKKKLDEMKYTGKDIRGLETFTVKQFQALHFLAHKAQNQTEEEKEALEIYKELGGFEDGKFRTIAYKESEYITNAQGKDHALVSTRERNACIDAIKEIEDVEFSVLWEKKGKKKKDTFQIVAHHEMFKKLTLKQPWSIIRETPKGKKIKNFHFIAIPERVFEYQEIKGGSKYDGVRVLFDVINLDPDFFTTLKYSDPEVKHVSEALMKLSLLFIIEGSFSCKEFIIDDEKLLKRLGLIEPKGRNKERGVKTLNMYIEKLIAHGTLTNAEKRGKQRVFNFPKKKKK
jgi:hypothetical protein